MGLGAKNNVAKCFTGNCSTCGKESELAVAFGRWLGVVNRLHMKLEVLPPTTAKPLRLLSVIIPARDEEGCIMATVEHLHLELALHEVPHEIVVVDDGSSDDTWPILQRLSEKN